jgi:hypothetical protein
MSWPTGTWFYGAYTGESVVYDRSHRLFDFRYSADTVPMNCPASTFPPPPCAPPEPSTAWVRVRATRGGGAVIVSRLTSVSASTIRTARTTELRVYTQQSGTSSPRPPALVGKLPDGRPWSSAGIGWSRVAGGENWATYQATLGLRAAPVAYSLDYPLSRVVFFPSPPPDQMVRIFGTKRLLP